MAKEAYVARGTIKFGAPDGSVVYFEDGDELHGMTDEQVLELRQAGSAIPKRVWDALRNAETAVQQAQEEQDRAVAESQTQQLKVQTNANAAFEEARVKAQAQLAATSISAPLPQDVGLTEPDPNYIAEAPAKAETKASGPKPRTGGSKE